MSKDTSALIIIDMQNEFCLDQEGSIKECYASIVDNINRVASNFRKNDQKVIWLNWGVDPSLRGMSNSQKEKFDNFEYPAHLSWKKEKNSAKKILEKGSWSATTINELLVDETDLHIDKERISGFWYSDLERILKDEGANKLYFAGINTDQCVITTLQDAHFAGFDCYLLEDCTATSSPEFCYEASLYNVNNCFGQVISSEKPKLFN